MAFDATIDTRALEAEIRAQAAEQDEVKTKGAEQAQEVKEYAQSISPTDSGEYAGAWHVEKRVRESKDGLPVFRVTNDDWKAHMIEFGTKADPDDTHSRFGRDTPTPEFGIRAKTAAHFGGTEAPAKTE